MFKTKVLHVHRSPEIVEGNNTIISGFALTKKDQLLQQLVYYLPL